jgi:hypothetical protein
MIISNLEQFEVVSEQAVVGGYKKDDYMKKYYGGKKEDDNGNNGGKKYYKFAKVNVNVAAIAQKNEQVAIDNFKVKQFASNSAAVFQNAGTKY